MPALKQRTLWPALTTVLVLTATTWQLRNQGRLWWCSCKSFLWTSNAWGAQTSQTFLDPYSLTHIVHGLLFCGLLALLIRRMTRNWRLVMVIAIESVWEIIENTNTIIQRYREATASLGYQGDTVVNSLGDITSCAVGFLIAWKLGWRRSIMLFAAIELILLIWIRDSLLLEIIMLIHPIDAVKSWQLGH